MKLKTPNLQHEKTFIPKKLQMWYSLSGLLAKWGVMLRETGVCGLDIDLGDKTA